MTRLPRHSLILAVLLLALPAAASAAAPASPLDEGNEQYLAGHFKQATAAYGAVLASGEASAALHYNLANAYFRQGQKGAAMLHYLRAMRLDPRDRDLRWNLDVLKGSLTDRLDPAGGDLHEWADTALSYVRPEEAALALTFFLLIVALASAARFFIPAARRPFGALRTLSLLLALVSGAVFGVRWAAERAPLAVVVESRVDARYGPSTKETRAFTLHEGAAVRVQDRAGDWICLALPNGTGGWVPSSACEIV